VRTNENRMRTYPWPFSAVYSTVPRWSGWIMTVNRDGLDVLRHHDYSGEASLLPYGVDVDLFLPSNAPVRDTDTLRVGFVGRVAPEKGVDSLLQAFGLLMARVRRGAKLAVHIYGSGEPAYMAQLHQLQRALGLAEDVIRWHGPIAHRDVPDAM